MCTEVCPTLCKATCLAGISAVSASIHISRGFRGIKDSFQHLRSYLLATSRTEVLSGCSPVQIVPPPLVYLSPNSLLFGLVTSYAVSIAGIHVTEHRIY